MTSPDQNLSTSQSGPTTARSNETDHGADPSISHVTALAPRLRQAGMALIACACNGELTEWGPSEDGSLVSREPSRINEGKSKPDWLAEIFCRSPLFRTSLKEAAATWSMQDEPAAIEAVPGAWLVPVPLLSRRRRTGYAVAIIPTSEFLGSEHLAAMCQSSQMDAQLCDHRLKQLPPASRQDVDRLSHLVRYAYQDHLRSVSDAKAIDAVGKQLAESYEEVNLLYSITQSMTVQERPERFIASVCQELITTVPYQWIGLQLLDDRPRLKGMAGRLIVAGSMPHPHDSVREVTRSLLSKAPADSPMVLEPSSNPKHAAYAMLGNSVLVQPVLSGALASLTGDVSEDASESTVIGILLACNKIGEDQTASNIDLKLLSAAAAHMAIFLENATLYEDLNAMFLGTLEALTASIDAKDRYTCGHSRRVAYLTQMLARAVGLDEHTINRCHIAGMVHDVGKIGVPERVLLKPGKLTDEEFEWIRKHPEIGHRILKDIPQLKDVLPGVLHHHERWDGRGYPDGLAGEAIPLMARLISLADSFDAMSSTRTYRSAMSRSQVIAEITRNAGTQFDPELAKAFITLNFSDYDRIADEHRVREIALRGKERAA